MTKKKNEILDLSPQLREMNQIMTPLNPLNVMMMPCHSISMVIWKNCMNLKMKLTADLMPRMVQKSIIDHLNYKNGNF